MWTWMGRECDHEFGGQGRGPAEDESLFNVFMGSRSYPEDDSQVQPRKVAMINPTSEDLQQMMLILELGIRRGIVRAGQGNLRPI